MSLWKKELDQINQKSVLWNHTLVLKELLFSCSNQHVIFTVEVAYGKVWWYQTWKNDLVSCQVKTKCGRSFLVSRKQRESGCIFIAHTVVCVDCGRISSDSFFLGLYWTSRYLY
jgi:hypothetical protein